MIYWQLTAVFTVLSLLGFGGGNAILPQMYNDSVLNFHWVTPQQFTSYYALARMGPGPGMTVSALIGESAAGFGGAVVATLAMFVPAAIFVFVLATLWDRYREHPFRRIFARAMIPVVVGLSWVASVVLGRGALDSPLAYMMAATGCVVLVGSKFNTALMVVIAGIIGAIFMK
jgi:chromate transporter